MIYTGIGSRKISQEGYNLLREIGMILGRSQWILRSGGAEGSDSAFEEGCDIVKGKKEVYLPWRGFRGKQGIIYRETPEMVEIIHQNHPNPGSLTRSARKLIGRDYLEIMGGYEEKSDVVIYWTDKESGGTIYTVNLARKLGIPVYNVYLNQEKDADLIVDEVCKLLP